MMREVPAEGYTLISGKQKPPKSFGDALYCQIRMGWCDPTPWPVSTTVWRWDWISEDEFRPSGGDVVAVRKVNVRSPQTKDGRQANGSYE